MKKKNEMLKAAFEEAARAELERLPDENRVIRPYSENFRSKMDTLLAQEMSEERKKSFRFGKIAAVAAVIAAVMCTFTASAFIMGDGIWKLVNFTPDPEDYETIDISSGDIIVKEDGYDTLIYNGEPVTLKYTIDTGESWEWPDRGVMLYLDGVRQTFDATVGEEKFENIDMLHLQSEQGTVKSVELTFGPNIGKKGDEMFLSVLVIYDPDVNYFTQCDTERKELFVGHWDDDNDSICDRCSVNIDEIPSGPSSYTIDSNAMFKMIMEKDAPSQTLIAEDFSGLKVDELDKKIYESYEYEDSYENKLNDYDTMQSLAAVLYKSVRSSYVSEWGVDGHVTRIKTKAKENDDFTINLHGATGKYRVSLYINNEIQNVFDGKAYADVGVVHGQQSELKINIDTTKLPKGDNYCYVLFQRLDGEEDVFRWIHYGLVYTLEVK